MYLFKHCSCLGPAFVLLPHISVQNYCFHPALTRPERRLIDMMLPSRKPPHLTAFFPQACHSSRDWQGSCQGAKQAVHKESDPTKHKSGGTGFFCQCVLKCLEYLVGLISKIFLVRKSVPGRSYQYDGRTETSQAQSNTSMNPSDFTC